MIICCLTYFPGFLVCLFNGFFCCCFFFSYFLITAALLLTCLTLIQLICYSPLLKQQSTKTYLYHCLTNVKRTQYLFNFVLFSFVLVYHFHQYHHLHDFTDVSDKCKTSTISIQFCSIFP